MSTHRRTRGSHPTLLDTSGTDPALSNAIADIVTTVLRQINGEDQYVPLDLRFGIAHELQRAGLTRHTPQTPTTEETP